eukprot:1476109-Pyramimonas_sp.AAC.1
MVKAPRTKGADLSDDICDDILSDHVPMATCQPTKLWRLDRISKQGLTSQWHVVKKNYSLLNAIVDRTSGRIPHQKKLHK